MAVGARGVATFGTSISQGQLELLLLSDAEELVVLWDRDALNKAWDLVESLSEHWRIRIATLPDARDIDEHSPEDRKKIVSQAKLVSPMDAWARKVRHQLKSF
jgi:DNA primase